MVDIILPRKRDRYGNRVGIMKTWSNEDALKVIKKINGVKLRKGTLYLALAKEHSNKASASGHRQGGKEKSPQSQQSSPKLSPENGNSDMREDPIKTDHVVDLPINVDYIKDPKCENKAKGQVVELSVNEDFAEELKCCLCLITAKHETVETVGMIVEGFGFRDVTIRGISGKKFLMYFEDLADWKDLDIDFLKIGFMEVGEVTKEDLIPMRKVWIELRGLPIIGWTEDNYIKLVQEWGEILHFGKTLDDGSFYTTPKVMIETTVLETIDVTRTIMLSGHTFMIRIMEMEVQEGQANILVDSHSDEEFYEKDITSPENAELKRTEVNLMGENDCAVTGSETVMDRVSEACNPEESADGSLINPMTPRYGNDTPQFCETEVIQPMQEIPELSQEEEEPEQILATRNWKPREIESSLSQLRSLSDNEVSEVDNYTDAKFESEDIHPSILKTWKI